MTPIQLDIIRTFGSKELSDGCIITGLCLDSYGELKERRLCIKTYAGYYLVSSKKGNFHDNCGIVSKPSSIEILGHIPELFPDVARVAKEKGIIIRIGSNETIIYGFIYKSESTFRITYNSTLPLIEQEESTLTQLLNLFK